jgi:hypothetical protein
MNLPPCVTCCLVTIPLIVHSSSFLFILVLRETVSYRRHMRLLINLATPHLRAILHPSPRFGRMKIPQIQLLTPFSLGEPSPEQPGFDSGSLMPRGTFVSAQILAFPSSPTYHDPWALSLAEPASNRTAESCSCQRALDEHEHASWALSESSMGCVKHGSERDNSQVLSLVAATVSASWFSN